MKYFYSFSFLTLVFIFFCSPSHADHKFVVFAPPKCGTHLIGKTLQVLLDKQPIYYLDSLGSTNNAVALAEDATEKNCFIVAHNWNDESLKSLVKKGYRVIFIMRDPRDHAISVQNWFREGHWQIHKVRTIEDRDEQLTELITGQKYHFKAYEACIGYRLPVYLRVPEKCKYMTRFENLVGEKGGGSREAQILELINLAIFLEHPIRYEEIEEIVDSIFGGTKTFRHGQLDQWKDSFKPFHIALYKQHYGKTLIELGYENDYNW